MSFKSILKQKAQISLRLISFNQPFLATDLLNLSFFVVSIKRWSINFSLSQVLCRWKCDLLLIITYPHFMKCCAQHGPRDKEQLDTLRCFGRSKTHDSASFSPQMEEASSEAQVSFPTVSLFPKASKQKLPLIFCLLLPSPFLLSTSNSFFSLKYSPK